MQKMGRPEKLLESKARELFQRYCSGEPVTALAKIAGVNVSTLRRRFATFGQQGETPEAISNVARQIAVAQSSLQSLPERARPVAIAIAAKLQEMSESLLQAGASGAKTSAMLHDALCLHVSTAMSTGELTAEKLQVANGMAEVANKAAKIGTDIIAAGRREALSAERQAVRKFDASKLDSQTLAKILEATDA